MTLSYDSVIVSTVAAEWTIDDLGLAVEAVLAADGPVQESGRIRDVPDRRTIRYYTTLGLLDRPAAMRGRTALYARRHLEQLVAIKRMQAEGLSLAEIQARLATLTPRELRALARVPANVPIENAAPKPAAEIAPPRRAFWSEVPASSTPSPAQHRDVQPRETTLASVQLAMNTMLTLAARRPPNPDEIRAIQHAAEPLLRVLRERNLIAEEGE